MTKSLHFTINNLITSLCPFEPTDSLVPTAINRWLVYRKDLLVGVIMLDKGKVDTMCYNVAGKDSNS